MIKIEFSEEDQAELQYERFHHPHPRVQMKMEALWLKSQGVKHHVITQLVGISANTLRSYLREYEEGRIEGLKEIRFYRPSSELMPHAESIEQHFRSSPPTSTNAAIAAIEKLTGIRRSPTQVRIFMKRLGMKHRKVGVFPAKADPEVQESYKQRELEPRIAEAKAGKRALFFVDAAHFVMGAFLGFVWCFERLFMRAPSGRKRYNVLAALNAITHEVITVTNDSYINSLTVCELLRKLAALKLEVPITIVLDNARYQKCHLVQDLAKTLGIELLYLPSYSPNLNLIERLWKFVKKKCLYSKYYEDFTSFQDAISNCIDNAHTIHKKELDSLLTLRFQDLKKAQLMTF